MDNLLQILTGVALVAAISVCAVLVFVMRRVSDVLLDLRETVGESKRLMLELNRQLPATFDSLNATSKQAQATLQNVDVQVGQLGEGLGQFKEIGTRINGLEAKLQDKIEGPLMQAAGVVSGISSAITSFVDGMKRR